MSYIHFMFEKEEALTNVAIGLLHLLVVKPRAM